MVKTRCPAIYKNLGLETFGDRKKVTDEMLKQFCKNDEWLRQQIIELRYLAPPAVRKSLRISETWDEEKSWGCMVKNGQVQFSNKIADSINIDFTTDEGINRWYDTVKSTTYVGQFDDDNRNIHKEKCVYLPFTDDIVKEQITDTFGTASIKGGYNSAWYVGFDKSKPFYLKPKWIKNWKNINLNNPKDTIPAIARAQTFKVPTGKGGRLVQVDIQLEYNGTPTASSSPLYVQIWDTYQGWVYDTKWDKDSKSVIKDYVLASTYGSASANWQKFKRIKVYEKNKKGNQIYVGKEPNRHKKFHYEYKKDNNGTYVVKRKKVAKPNSRGGNTIKNPLAEYVYNPTNTNKGGEQSMTFNITPTLEAGKSYAVVLFSPLNNWENCPRWCGWGRNCDTEVYNDGDAFISYDNGQSWKRYGKDGREEGINVYRQGKYVPQDYRFKCHVVTQEEEIERHYHTEKELYLKPIYSNPITYVELHPDDDDTSVSGFSIEYKISTDGYNWDDFSQNDNIGYYYNLSKPSRVIFIKAVLCTPVEQVNGEYTDYGLYTPTIDSIHIDLKMNLPTDMYVRTKPYTPDKFGTILGASVWGRVFAPYSLTDETEVDCKVDVIQTKENIEYFDIVDLELLDEKINEKQIPNMEWIETHETADSRCRYLADNPSIVNTLRDDYKIYILPHELDDGLYLLSFALSDDKLVAEEINSMEADEVDDEDNVIDTTTVPMYSDDIGGIKLVGEVAYPVISCQLEPEDGEGHGQVSAYGEWYDYTFDYVNNELKFKIDTLNRMANGHLAITYNPVFIKDLTNEEIGIHYDEDTGLRSDGLILDYFRERFLIGEEEVQSKTVKLKVDAVDPIKLVYLYTSSDEEPLELMEDVDYYFDVDSRELVFDVEDSVTVLDDGNVLEVVYVPNLDDTSICIGYNAVRTSTSAECIIDDYYIEYKV